MRKYRLSIILWLVFEAIAVWLWQASGNLFFLLKDNRAFCKYICPITVFLKPMSYYALIRIKCDEDKCINCGKCLRTCPIRTCSMFITY